MSTKKIQYNPNILSSMKPKNKTQKMETKFRDKIGKGGELESPQP